MLYFKTDGAAVPWNGELISDIRYPRNIELLWSDAELAEIGLFRPPPADPVPPGKIAVGETVQIVGDNVKVVLQLEDEPSPPAPTPVDVWGERDRRLSAGFDYNFADARGIHHIGTTVADLVGWDEVTKFSQALISTGDPDGTITILTDTGPAVVTALEWQQVMLAAAAFRQPIWGASFALAAMDPIPADYATNEAYWP